MTPMQVKAVFPEIKQCLDLDAASTFFRDFSSRPDHIRMFDTLATITSGLLVAGEPAPIGEIIADLRHAGYGDFGSLSRTEFMCLELMTIAAMIPTFGELRRESQPPDFLLEKKEKWGLVFGSCDYTGYTKAALQMEAGDSTGWRIRAAQLADHYGWPALNSRDAARWVKPWRR